ncbi:hypothetical protein OH76DRAFT_1328493, partial [Lentinus brumalis]
LAVEVGLLMAASHGLLDALPRHHPKLLIRSDNMGVVQVLNSGRSRSGRTNAVLRRIYLALAQRRLHVAAVHVPSRLNVADALSRGDVTGFL